MSMQPGSYSFIKGNSMSEPTYTDSQFFNLRNVWDSNLDEEMRSLMAAVESYPYIAMVRKRKIHELKDTEFPGICYPGSDENSNIFEYSILRNNVNKLKIIQLGITVCTASGQVATDYPTWQFNFKFNPE